MSRSGFVGMIFIVAWAGGFAPLLAANVYVDNADGVDSHDGTAATVQTVLTGPVRTFRRALQLVKPGDTLVLRNTGLPYAEPLCLVGGRHSGFETQPFTVRGNGAVISGLRTVPPDGWRSESNGVWRLSLTRKGTYRFFLGDQAVPEYLPTAGAATIADLPLAHYLSKQGAVYFRFDAQATPYSQTWTYAADEIGVSLVSVRNVRIENLTVVGFRIDGLNADGNCRGVLLDNVTLESNGRAGLSANGTSRVFAENCRVAGNGRHAVLITEFASANLEGCDLDSAEPTIAP